MAALDFPTSPSNGQKYPVSPIAGQPQYTWDSTGGVWNTVGAQISNAAPATTTPAMDAGAGAVGTGTSYARNDHVHPADTLAVRTEVAQSLTANQQAQARSNIGQTKKNYLLNGAMQISQENGTTSGTTALFYPVDQWFTEASGLTTGTLFIQQVNLMTPGGSQYRLRLTCTAVQAGALVDIAQKMEGFRVVDLGWGTATAKPVVLQLGVRAPAGTYNVNITNSGATVTVSGSFTIAAGEAGADVVKLVTFAGQTTGTWLPGSGIGLWLSIFATPIFSTLNATFDLFDVGLYEGSVAPPFMVPDYGNELAACQRYWTRNPIAFGQWLSTTELRAVTTFMVPMRATPTIALIPGQGSGAVEQLGVAFRDVTAASLGSGTSYTGAQYILTTAAAATGACAMMSPDRLSNNARL